ncbi:MAG: tetratricopeptide repeat protein [Bacteroidota bacterium]
MKEKKNKVFHEPDCLSQDLMLDYVRGALSSKEKHRVEKHVLDCALCSDALEGLMLMPDKDRIKSVIDNINRNLIPGKQKAKVIWMDTRVRVAIAAGLALLIVSVFLFRNELKESSPNQTVSENKMEKKEDPKPSGMDSNASFTPPKPDESGKLKTLEDKKTEKEVHDLSQEEQLTRSFKDESNKTVESPPPSEVTADEPQDAKSDKDGTFGYVGGNKLSESDKTKEDKNTDDVSVVSPNSNAPAVTNNGSSTTVTTVTTEGNYQKSDVEKYVKKGKEESGKKSKSKGNKSEEGEKQSNQPKKSAQNMPNYGFSQSQSQNEVLYDMETAKDTAKQLQKPIMDSLSVTGAMDLARKSFDAKEYDKAAKQFEQILKVELSNQEAMLYAARCYIFLNQPDQAIQKLDAILAFAEKENTEAAKYYKALALLKKNDKEGAKKLLSEVAGMNGPYKSRAEEELKKVK